MSHITKIAALITALCLTASGALSDQVFSDDVIVDGQLCAGQSCANGEAFSSEALRLKNATPDLRFIDVNAGNHDWLIDINNGIANRMAVQNLTAGTIPFLIEGDASTNAFVIDGNGIGIETFNPTENLHVVDPSVASIRLEDVGGTPGAWDISAANSQLFVVDVANGAAPLVVSENAGANAFVVAASGNIGMGVPTPEGKLHTRGFGVQLAYMESSDGGPVQMRFRTDSENRRFLAVNNANEVKSQIIFKDNEILFTGQTDSGANRWLTIGPTGIVSQGPSCNPGPCDATFDRDAFEVPSIEDHAAYMWENQHLWAVGPTSPNAPFNLTQKAGGMLHELEVAHIYIEQLNSELKTTKQAYAELQDDLELLKANQAMLMARFAVENRR